MNIKLEKVFERDIDFLMINKFVNDKNISDYFLNLVNLTGYNVIGVEHSYMDADGESDITVILSNETEKIAFLIEDKIDAIAMPEQYNRYKKRGEKGIFNKLYDKFFIFIIAPNDYLKSNKEAEKYDYKISYESLLDLMSNDIYAICIFKKALEEKKNGYTIIENKMVTKFWEDYYNYIETYYPKIRIKRYEGPRGQGAWWPGFDTPVKYIRIMFKADRGFVDLTFPNVANKYYEVLKIIENQMDNDMTLETTSKSLAVRINVDVVKFDGEFKNYINEINISLNAVERLVDFLGKIDYEKILELR